MNISQIRTLLTLLSPKSVNVQFTDPQTNTTATATYYGSDVPAGYLVKRTNGVEYWGGLSATFEESDPR